MPLDTSQPAHFANKATPFGSYTWPQFQRALLRASSAMDALHEGNTMRRLWESCTLVKDSCSAQVLPHTYLRDL